MLLMLNIKPIVAALSLVFSASTFVTFSAQAIPVSADLFSSGDGLITRDAGLDWLDLTVTTNTSFDNMNNGTATFAILGNLNPVVDLGFRYATTAEVTQLFTNGGMSAQDGGNRLGDFAAAQFLVGLLGTTNSPSTYILSEGIADAGLGLRLPFVRYSLSSGTGAASLGNTPGSTTESAFWGSYLVRNSPAAIPEPGTLTILIVGLVGLGFARRCIAA